MLILAGLTLGIAAGLFFGDAAAGLDIVGQAFIRLLQMSVLPYMAVALILGFGTLAPSDATTMARRGGLLIVLFWGTGLAAIFALSRAFPAVEHAAFFSTSQLAPSEDDNLLDVFIPSNVFKALAEGRVPAVVLFATLFGVLLIKVEEKQSFIAGLAAIQETLEGISYFIFRLSPIGIFALTASQVGTLEFERLENLEVYLACYAVGAALVGLFILPFLVGRLLGRRYGEVMGVVRGALILGFTSGNSLITLPLIERAVKMLFRDQAAEDSVAFREVGVLIPVAYNLPTIGTLFSLLFILFTGWMYDKPLDLPQYLHLALAGLFNLFSEVEVAMPSLLDFMKLPGDSFQLFLVSDVLTDLFEAGLDVMSIFALTSLYVGALTKSIVPGRARKLQTAVIICLALGATIGVMRIGLSQLIATVHTEKDVLMRLSIASPVEATVSTDPPPGPAAIGSKTEPPGSALRRILGDGVLRVGYNAESLPFAYLNGDGQLVGYDIAMAHSLARSLGVGLRFVPFRYDGIPSDLASGRYDIAMSAVSTTFERLRQMDFSQPYMTLHLALVVPDYQRRHFRTRAEIGRLGPLRIAVLRGSAYVAALRSYLPDATPVEIDDRKSFFEGSVADAMLTTAEQGAAWGLLYPAYTVIVPDPTIGEDFLAYPVARGSPDLLIYLNQWLTMERQREETTSAYDYWILGKEARSTARRWSILHDVLHLDGQVLGNAP
ncbi:cation:dicarboxylate symporter family transporter [Inquilinus sp. CA228]|uniref:cation:dicarboxylate symporter family transporter n=1 Tax=Inquilinus sp. CA228 TaxID=3455609 RepID=UPI003F8D7B67